ncbi:MAG: flavin reductase family protein [Xanthobacteraceae bacterium]|nr:flavin reductase family protein [Xanthobacteraceae bacterium]QYK43952.1 MAG: flavin reductase family protein [Xanthobacteraceae bacterium]
MFYEPPKRNHGLPHDPFKAIIAPRPIGWISSLSAKGELNLAPYSFFNGVATFPPMVMFSSDSPKDSLHNIRETGEFVCSLATWDLRDAMNKTSQAVPGNVNEFELAGLEAAPSKLVKPPRVAASPVALECKATQILQLTDANGNDISNIVVFGQVMGIYIDDRFLKNGILDTAGMKPIARCGYRQYAVVTELFEMTRPDER